VYDWFGNLNKNGSMSFAPFYSSTTNRMTSFPGGFTPTYDNNGNVTNDGLHTYTWDAEGRPVTVDGASLTYDALARIVEKYASGTYTQVVYDPSGAKLALMAGQTLVNGFVPLPGGAAAVYTSSGLHHYRHPDWLGSARFASTTTRTMYSVTAYAPFGETYAQVGTADPSYTGQNQDTAGDLYDFLFRGYGIQGRWPSPGSSASLTSSLDNPQSLNRYAYVLNAPLHMRDRDGTVAGSVIMLDPMQGLQYALPSVPTDSSSNGKPSDFGKPSHLLFPKPLGNPFPRNLNGPTVAWASAFANFPKTETRLVLVNGVLQPQAVPTKDLYLPLDDPARRAIFNQYLFPGNQNETDLGLALYYYDTGIRPDPTGFDGLRAWLGYSSDPDFGPDSGVHPSGGGTPAWCDVWCNF